MSSAVAEEKRLELYELEAPIAVVPVNDLTASRAVQELRPFESGRWRPSQWAPCATVAPDKVDTLVVPERGPRAVGAALRRWARRTLGPAVHLHLGGIVAVGGTGTVYRLDRTVVEAHAPAAATAVTTAGVVKLIALDGDAHLNVFLNEAENTRRAARCHAAPAQWAQLVLVDRYGRACGALLQARGDITLYHFLEHWRLHGVPPAVLPLSVRDVLYQYAHHGLPNLLRRLHSKANVAHGDLTPLNTVLSLVGGGERAGGPGRLQVRLIDFGLSLRADRPLSSARHYAHPLPSHLSGADADRIFATYIGAGLWEEFPLLARPAALLLALKACGAGGRPAKEPARAGLRWAMQFWPSSKREKPALVEEPLYMRLHEQLPSFSSPPLPPPPTQPPLFPSAVCGVCACTRA